MHSQSGGTLTAIFMLIPLVAVPYFAIRGTRDLDGSLPSLSGKDDIAFASSENFQESSAEMLADESGSDAPAFPTDETEIHAPATGIGSAAEDWSSNPFDQPPEAATSLKDRVQDTFDEFKTGIIQEPPLRSGLSGAQVRTGGNSASQQSPPVHRVSGSRTTDVRTEWRALIDRLKTSGMRNYRVETVPDKSVYYVTAFFPNPRSGVTRRYEGEGRHPLVALRSVMQQVDDASPGNLVQ